MNVKLRLADKMSKKQKDDIRQYCAEELRRQQQEHTRRMLKIFCVALHTKFGFGKDRCIQAIDEINQLSDERNHDEIFWTHIDRMVEQIGLKFKQENYEEMDL